MINIVKRLLKKKNKYEVEILVYSRLIKELATVKEDLQLFSKVDNGIPFFTIKYRSDRAFQTYPNQDCNFILRKQISRDMESKIIPSFKRIPYLLFKRF